MNIDFSLVQASDKEQLLQLLSNRQDESNQLRGKIGNFVRERGGEFFDKMLSNKDILLIVGKKSDEIVATATLYLLPKIRKSSYTAIIEDLLVAKEYRDKGVGTLLMKYAIRLCQENKEIRKIKLASRLESEKAHKFYKKLGFEFKEKFFQLPLK